jgi:uncharacterized protein YndB with AHSA1/START domain
MHEDEGGRAMVLERVLEAPVGQVWSMWTEPEHFAAWYGPVGAVVTVLRMDVRIGGSRLVGMVMETPDGPAEMWFAGEFRAVVPETLLVYSESMADREGNVLAASDLGMPDGHAGSTEIRLELEDLGGRTRMVLTHLGIAADSPGAAGWSMALDKLASRLAA